MGVNIPRYVEPFTAKQPHTLFACLPSPPPLIRRPCNPQQKRLFSQVSLFPARSTSRREVVCPSPIRIRHAHAHTRAALPCPERARCTSLPLQVSFSFSLGPPRYLLSLLASPTRSPTRLFLIRLPPPNFPVYRDVGSLPPSPGHAVASVRHPLRPS